MNVPRGPVFEGTDPAMKGFIFDVPNGMNHDQFTKTVKKLAIIMGPEMGMYATDFSTAFNGLLIAMPALVAPPAAGADDVTIYLWKLALKEFQDKTKAILSFLAKLYLKVEGQCTTAMKSSIQRHPDFEVVNGARDGYALLRIIESVTMGVEGRTNTAVVCAKAKIKFYKMRQGHKTLLEYYEEVKAADATLERIGVSLADDAVIEEIAAGHGRAVPNMADKLKGRHKAVAVHFVLNSSYPKYVAELHYDMLNEEDHYPMDLATAYEIMHLRGPENVRGAVHHEGVAFANVEGRVPVPGRNGRVYAHIDCRICNNPGHFADQCTVINQDAGGQEGNHRTDGFSFSQVEKNAREFIIPKSWVLLDNQSTVDVFHNRDLLRNIRRVGSRMYIHCNAGTQWTDQQGDLPGYGPVWYCPSAIANILSLHNVSNRCRVEFDSKNGDSFVVTNDENGHVNVFRASEQGLYYYDINAADKDATVLVNTVKENKTSFTNAEIEKAEYARALQRRLGHVTMKEFIRIVTNNLLPNCPVTKRDIMVAEFVFGPDLGSLKGKTVRRAPPQVDTTLTYNPLPASVHEKHREVTLGGDIMFINKIAFFVTTSLKIKFGTVEYLEKQTAARMTKAIQNVLQVYHSGGFRVKHVRMDGQFECLRGPLLAMGVLLNTTSRDEHVGFVERYIRVLKERSRCSFNTVPFKKMTTRMVIELASRVVFWLNAFPPADGISKTLSPRTIVTGRVLNHDRHCQYEFGEYVQTHEEHDNSMTTRTIGALAMRPTGNNQGSYYFLSLDSGRIINRIRATKMPMPNEVIDRVHRMARQQKANPGLEFLDRNHQPIEDDDDSDSDDDDDESYQPDDDAMDDDDEEDDDDDTYHPQNDEDDDDDDAPDMFEYDSDEDDNEESADGSEEDSQLESDSVADGAPIAGETELESDAEASDEDIENSHGDEDVASDDDSESEDDEVEDNNSDIEEDKAGITGVPANQGEITGVRPDEMDIKYGARTGHHNLRARKPRSYGHLHSITHSLVEGEESLATTQMSMKQGIKTFGQEGVTVVGKEMQQLHDRNAGKPKSARELTAEERREALGCIPHVFKAEEDWRGQRSRLR